jgi:transglutaminase-like putative cysteine protease
MIRVAMLGIGCFAVQAISAQGKNNFKFGKVSATDFNVTSPAIDTASNAVVLADIGSSTLEGNNKGFFSLKYTHLRRVKILNKKGMDAADISIVLYTSGNAEEKLDECKALTYNLENGDVKQTKLENSSIFKERLSKNAVVRKFTFPNVKEGSILEYTYTITSDFLTHLRPWEFQGTSWPRVYSEYTVKIPQFFSYVFLAQGYISLKSENSSKMQSFNISEQNGTQASRQFALSGYENTNRWIACDVPVLKEENYTSTIENHLSKIDFQLKQTEFPGQTPTEYIGSWAKAAENMLKREDFGTEITRANLWLNDDIKNITEGANSNQEKARRLYAFVRDNFTATYNAGVYLNDNTTLKEIFRKKSGNVAEINLLLIAMLRNAGLTANPVVISTRGHGWAHPIYPLMTKYNYLVCQTLVDGQPVYLDASRPKMGFGKLSPDCYNGPGFVVKQQPVNISFEADSVSEHKTTMIFLTQDDKNGLKGFFKSTPGYYESTTLRSRLAKESMDDLVKEVKKSYSFPVVIKNQFVDSLNQFDHPVTLGYDMNFDFEDQDIVYFNPMFSEITTKNPFSAADRKYPVEMPFKVSENYILNMDIPRGYKVDEIPKSARVRLNENDGMFEYLISATDRKIMLNCKIELKKAYFPAEDYQTLREFFGYVTKKQSEQIVLKKIK